MPAELERCVKGIMAKWRENPDEKPKRAKDGNPVEGDDDLRSVAFAMCNAQIKQNWEGDQETIRLLLSGQGPTLAGVALTNRPFLKGLPVASVVVEDEREKVRVPFFRYGRFRHPKAPDGKLIFDDAFLERLINNFEGNTYNQKVFLDRAHKPDDGALGELERIEREGDIAAGIFLPNQAGLDLVKGKRYMYGSMDFFVDYQGNEISMSCSDEEMSELELTDEVYESLLLFNSFHDKRSGGGNSEEEKMSELDNGVETRVELTQAEYDALLAQSQRLAEVEAQQELVLADLQRQRAELYVRDVRAFLKNAEVPVDGRAYSKPVLETVEKLLLNQAVGESDSIQLSEEDKESLPQVVKYFHDGVRYLLSLVPRDVPVDAEVELREQRPMNATALGEMVEKDAEELAAFILGVNSKEE